MKTDTELVDFMVEHKGDLHAVWISDTQTWRIYLKSDKQNPALEGKTLRGSLSRYIELLAVPERPNLI